MTQLNLSSEVQISNWKRTSKTLKRCHQLAETHFKIWLETINETRSHQTRRYYVPQRHHF